MMIKSNRSSCSKQLENLEIDMSMLTWGIGFMEIASPLKSNLNGDC